MDLVLVFFVFCFPGHFPIASLHLYGLSRFIRYFPAAGYLPIFHRFNYTSAAYKNGRLILFIGRRLSNGCSVFIRLINLWSFDVIGRSNLSVDGGRCVAAGWPQ